MWLDRTPRETDPPAFSYKRLGSWGRSMDRTSTPRGAVSQTSRLPEGEARDVWRGTALVPTGASDLSRSPSGGDAWDGRDACGRIYTRSQPAGGRAVAGSNPVAPT